MDIAAINAALVFPRFCAEAIESANSQSAKHPTCTSNVGENSGEFGPRDEVEEDDEAEQRVGVVVSEVYPKDVVGGPMTSGVRAEKRDDRIDGVEPVEGICSYCDDTVVGGGLRMVLALKYRYVLRAPRAGLARRSSVYSFTVSGNAKAHGVPMTSLVKDDDTCASFHCASPMWVSCMESDRRFGSASNSGRQSFAEIGEDGKTSMQSSEIGTSG
jgi:hypothetical protein